MISTHLSKNILIFLTMKINNNRIEIILINFRILYSFIRILDPEHRITQSENTHNFVGGGDFMQGAKNCLFSIHGNLKEAHIHAE